jgi:hypothetical protein
MRWAVLVTCIGLTSVLGPSGSVRADCVDYDRYLHWEGFIGVPFVPEGVAVSNGYAYVAQREQCLQVVDVRNPLRPLLLGSVNTPWHAQDVAVEGSYAYVAGAGGLQIVDISNPMEPRVVGQAGIWDGRDVVVGDGLAYVASWDGLTVLDIREPANPQVLGGVGCEGCYGVTLSGHYAYVVGYCGLLVLDVADPGAPRVAAQVSTVGVPLGVAVSGHLACVAEEASPGAFEVFDITNPESPRKLGSTIPVNGSGWGVAISGTHAYVAATSGYVEPGGSLIVIDLEDPENARIVGGAFAGYAEDVAMEGGYAFVADELGRLHVIDISHPESPPVLGSTATADWATQVAISGRYGYVAEYDWPDQCGHLQVVDLEDPRNPQIVGTVLTPQMAVDVAVSGHYAYVADVSVYGWGGDPGIRVVDVTDPAEPRIVASLPMEGISRLVLNGHCLYVATGALQVVSVADPEHPQLVATVPTTGAASDVAISGEVAYVAEGSVSLETFDISSPTNPLPLGVLGRDPGEVLGGSDAVAVSGSHAYITGGNSTIRVVDVANPEHPRRLGCVGVGNGGLQWTLTQHLAASGTGVYYCGGYAGLQVIDASDPRSPRFLGNVLTGGSRSLALSDSCVYVASMTAGLQVVSTQCEQPSGISAVGEVGTGPLQVWPDPARREATLCLALPTSGRVEASIHDISGCLVRRVFNGVLGAGSHQLLWDGRDEGGHAVVAGIYLARISTPAGPAAARIVLVR